MAAIVRLHSYSCNSALTSLSQINAVLFATRSHLHFLPPAGSDTSSSILQLPRSVKPLPHQALLQLPSRLAFVPPFLPHPPPSLTPDLFLVNARADLGKHLGPHSQGNSRLDFQDTSSQSYAFGNRSSVRVLPAAKVHVTTLYALSLTRSSSLLTRRTGGRSRRTSTTTRIPRGFVWEGRRRRCTFLRRG